MPDRIRTYDLLLRKQTLYPAELRAHTFLVRVTTFRVDQHIVDVFDDIHLEIK